MGYKKRHYPTRQEEEAVNPDWDAAGCVVFRGFHRSA